MKKLTLLCIVVLFTTFVYSQCNIIYVTPTGTGVGTQANPASLNTALSLATNGTVIRMSIGTYTINNPITIPTDGVTLEGGFDHNSNWIKTSIPGATNIHRSSSNPEGAANAQRLVGIYGIGRSNFRFQDITITTAGASTAGGSTYGVHLTNCSNYYFTRTQILPGAGGPGQAGMPGTPGANGSPGGAGIQGDIDDEGNPGEGGPGGNGAGTGFGTGGAGGQDPTGDNNCGCFAGLPGNPGGAAAQYRAGGGGGGGGCGGEENHSGGNAGNGGANFGGTAQTGGGVGGGPGDPGGDGTSGNGGAAGANGLNGAAGAAGTHVGGFFVPGAQGAAGGDGQGGKGGRGGGGGGGQYCTFCDDGGGNGGGGGGGGGQGASGGLGGYGGGGSFCVYLVSNGPGVQFDDCRLVSGASGAGGTGGSGAAGGSGGTGGPGGTTGLSEIGGGGNGGSGGAGGSSGSGGNGAAGVSSQIYLSSGSAPILSDINFNLPAQPVITGTLVNCTGDNMTFAAGASALWNLGICSSPTSPTGTSVNTAYSCTGRKNITYSGNLYTGFTYISCASSTSNLLESVCNSYNSPSGNYTWTSSGTYQDTINNSIGCDSVITVYLTVVNSTSSGINVAACESYQSPSGNYTWSSSNTYVDTIANAGGCDSIITINLTILNPSASSINVTACDSYQSPSGNYTWTNSNTYMDTIPNASGCDSVITINLTINSSTVGTANVSACNSYQSPSGNYTWTSSNTYLDTIPNASGCDSVITINLTILNSSASTIAPVSCDSYLSPSGNYTWTSSNTYLDTVPNASGCDSVITVNLTINNANSSSISPIACGSYNSPSGMYTYVASGTYSDTISNAIGCDSVITINLTINNADVNVSQSGTTLTSSATSATYQWLDCNNSFAPISGETSSVFVAPANGSYAVAVTQNNCTDTSVCYLVTTFGLNDPQGNSIAVLIFPNPAEDYFNVQLNEVIKEEFKIEIFDALGKIVFNQSMNSMSSQNMIINSAGWKSGLYTVKVTGLASNISSTSRIIIK